MRIAILTTGSSTHTKGIMNFVCEEARQLKKREDGNFKCDVFMIRIGRSRALKSVIGRKNKDGVLDTAYDEGCSSFEVDGVRFNNIWIKEGLIGFIIRTRFTHLQLSDKQFRVIAKEIKDYDYILTHKSVSQYVGYRMWRVYHIPFGAFWHGTELASTTFANKEAFKLTKTILENAQSNLFVSKYLLGIATRITDIHNGQVVYTGPSEMFYAYSPEKKKEIRSGFGVSDKDVVIAYAGNLIPVKNVLQLPLVFNLIKRKCPEKSFKFWIMGNGELEDELRAQLDNSGVDYTMHGKVQPNRMPDYMNCVDALLLISKKEGLGLVCLEAMKCGARAFGSMAGGIPEVVGYDHCAVLNDAFAENLSSIIVGSIRHEEKRRFPDIFSWDVAVNRIIESIGA